MLVTEAVVEVRTEIFCPVLWLLVISSRHYKMDHHGYSLHWAQVSLPAEASSVIVVKASANIYSYSQPNLIYSG